ncbi:MAG: peroxiredoxin [Sphingorhabdus sp.]
MTDVNDSLPSVIVTDSEGTQMNLAEIKGAFVLYFYPKADTPGCTKEGQEFTALSDDFAKAGYKIYAISKDAPAKLAKFAAKYGFTITLLSDETGDATEKMGVWIEKSMYGKVYMGIDRSTFIVGSDGKVKHTWHKVKVAGHAAEVLATAQKLG